MKREIKENYYLELKKISIYFFEKYKLSKFIKCDNIEQRNLLKSIYLEQFYNILIDITNQIIFDVCNKFSKDEMSFIIDFEIDKIMSEIINTIIKKIYI